MENLGQVVRSPVPAEHSPSAASPSTAAQQPAAAPRVEDVTKAKAVRLLWCDTGGIRRCRVIPARRYASALSRRSPADDSTTPTTNSTATHRTTTTTTTTTTTSAANNLCTATINGSANTSSPETSSSSSSSWVGCGVGITSACMALPAFADSPAGGSGLSAVGEVTLGAVEGSRVALPWSPGHHMALAEFREAGGPWACCPRTALRNTCSLLAEKFGLTLKVGFEIEFLLLEQAPPGSADKGAAGDGSGGCGSEGGLYGSGWRLVDSALYCQSSALDRQAEVLDAMVSALEAVGVGVLQWHAESAPGQYEVALMYGDAVAAADGLLLAKEALVGVAHRHGLAVSFLPKPLPQHAGSGCHAHLSLWQQQPPQASRLHCPLDPYPQQPSLPPSQHHQQQQQQSQPPPQACALAQPNSHSLSGTPLEPPSSSSFPSSTHPAPAPAPALPTISPSPSPSAPPALLSFLAGVLAHLEPLLPFTAPCPNSYARLQPGCWAGAHAAWGVDNREAPLRLTGSAASGRRLRKWWGEQAGQEEEERQEEEEERQGDGGESMGGGGLHLEYKALDGTANPYIALAAIAVAGMLGLSCQLAPPPPCQLPPAQLPPEAARRLGVRPLPPSLDTALRQLQTSSEGEVLRAAMTEAIGAPLLQAYLAVRQAEAEHAPLDRMSDLLLRYS